MPPEGTSSSATLEANGPWASGADRSHLLVFVNDAATETTLRESLADAIPETFEITRGGIRAAIQALQKIPTPRNLIVDISGDEEPLTALLDLSQVVEPDVNVLVVGTITDLDFYREVTRGLGVREYLPKPLIRDMIVRLFTPVIAGRLVASQELQGGRVITVTGARGGVGASTLAVNLAWHFGVKRGRHTLLLDPDLHTGTAAFYVDATPGPGLRAALELPDRIDNLFLERAAQVLQDRLHVLAGQEPLKERLNFAVDAAPRLLATLRRRYNFIVVDVPSDPLPLYRDLLDLASQRVIVLEPTLAGVRDALRLRALHDGQATLEPTILLLNRLNMPGGLTQAQVEDALEGKVDMVIPDLPKRLAAAANMGEPEARKRGFFQIRVEELARLTAFNRLLDSTTSAPTGAKRRNENKRFWRIWKKR